MRVQHAHTHTHTYTHTHTRARARAHAHARMHSCHGYRPVTAHTPTARHNHALEVNAFNTGPWGVYRLPAAYSGLIADMVVTENSLIKRTQRTQSIYMT